MKKLLILTSIVSAAFIQNLEATPFLPHLGPIRTEIVNQQVIVSNTTPLNKPLATALRKALLQIDRPTPTNLVNDTKALSSIAGTLNKTSLSNTFDPLIRTALGNYVGVLGADLHSISNALVTTFPSGPHTAANNLIAAAFDSVEAVIANGNTTLATKALAAVTKKLPAIQNLLTKAINAPAPSARFTATVTGDILGTFNFTPIHNVIIVTYQGGSLRVAGTNFKIAGATSRTLVVTVPNIIDGTTTYNFATQNGPGLAHVEWGVGSGATGQSDLYRGTSGTLTVTVNTAARTAVASFNFIAPGDNTGTTASSNNGVFSVTWQ